MQLLSCRFRSFLLNVYRSNTTLYIKGFEGAAGPPLRPYVDDFSLQWVAQSTGLLARRRPSPNEPCDI
jgi:hypothetical protein